MNDIMLQLYKLLDNPGSKAAAMQEASLRRMYVEEHHKCAGCNEGLKPGDFAPDGFCKECVAALSRMRTFKNSLKKAKLPGSLRIETFIADYTRFKRLPVSLKCRPDLSKDEVVSVASALRQATIDAANAKAQAMRGQQGTDTLDAAYKALVDDLN